MAERWLRIKDLTDFAHNGKSTPANSLWRLIEGELARPILKEYPGLTLRNAATGRPWAADDRGRAACEVSLSSLLAAREKIDEGVVKGYGPATHALFCQWVDSMQK